MYKSDTLKNPFISVFLGGNRKKKQTNQEIKPPVLEEMNNTFHK